MDKWDARFMELAGVIANWASCYKANRKIGAVIVKAERKPVLSVIGMFAATWVPYLLGTAWLAYSAHMTFGAAFGVGVAPFLVEDFCKMVAAAVVGPLLYSALSSAGLLQVSAQRR